ncbi:MAG: DUF6076 domain-containing protein [Ethanoligenens sp.]
MKYGCLMDEENDLEEVMAVRPGETEPMELGEAPLFGALCNVMSLDLYQTMMGLLCAEKPAEDAVKLPYIFLDDAFLEAYKPDSEPEEEEESPDTHFALRDLFYWLHHFKAWFEGMRRDSALWDGELFRSYAELKLGTHLPVLHRVEGDPQKMLFHINQQNPEADYHEITDSFVQSMQENPTHRYYVADGFREFLVMELNCLIQSRCTISTCRNCGRVFVAYNRSDTQYCDRPSPQESGKTCREYGAYSTRLEKVRQDEATHLYKQLYNMMQNRYRRTKGPQCPQGQLRLRQELEDFIADNKAWKKQMKAGKFAEQQYVDWLKSQKEAQMHGEHHEAEE